jgi:hypothetical protein
LRILNPSVPTARPWLNFPQTPNQRLVPGPEGNWLRSLRVLEVDRLLVRLGGSSTFAGRTARTAFLALGWNL